jgi:signal transduction histidine kinase/ActR/RegA family two-component response regulator
MSRDRALFRSRVARRIFALFVLCALLPSAGVAILAFGQVTNQLFEDSQRRLGQSTKAVAIGIYERLLLLETEMRAIASTLPAEPRPSPRATPRGSSPRGAEGFLALSLINPGDEATPLIGSAIDPAGLPPRARRELAAGRTVLFARPSPDGPPEVLLGVPRKTQRPSAGSLLGQIDPSYLWGIGDRNTLPPRTDLCVLDESLSVLVCSFPEAVTFPQAAMRALAGTASGRFGWDHAGTAYLAGYWSIPLQFQFSSSRWIVVLSEERADALAPMASFARTFPLVIILSLSVVILISIGQIRRSLVPLELLRAGTHRIAMKEFDSRVTVTSGDEFQDLAVSFNAMAAELGCQFRTLTAVAEIVRAILSALEPERIVHTILHRMPDIFPSEDIRMTLIHGAPPTHASTYLAGANGEQGSRMVKVALTAQDLQALRDTTDHLTIPVEDQVPVYLGTLPPRSARWFLILPIFVRHRLGAILGLGFPGAEIPKGDDVTRARQVADQVAVALANAQEIEERRQAEASLHEANRRLELALADLKATQQQMLQQERLSALGQMASGIAHDFNNTLFPILGYSDLLLQHPERLDDKETLSRILRTMNTAAYDAADVVRRLREFYRPREAGEMSGSVAMNALIDEAILLTQPRWRDQALARGVSIRLETDLGDVPPFSGNDAEIREILTNLIFNAADAMPEGGTIALRTRPDGDQILLEVRDTGIGMTEEVRQRCLEPFFTTKGERGTGLGLSMVHGIIRRHAGSLAIESAPGHGTAFRIRFPRRATAPAPVQAPEEGPVSPPQRVLVVDDDAGVRDVLVAYLTGDGHTVVTAADGREGLERVRGGRFDVILTDMAIPELTGDQLARAAKQIAPGIPVVLVTGFGELLEASEEKSTAVDILLEKPVTLAALRGALAACSAIRTSTAAHRVA